SHLTRFMLALRFDERMDRAVRDLWDATAAEGIAVVGVNGHRPHISIASYDVDDLQYACDTLELIVQRIEQFPMRLHSLGVFPERSVAFLSPHFTESLFSLHRKLLQGFADAGFPPVAYKHLEIDKWTPHCTVVTDASPNEVTRALDVLVRTWEPISGWVEAIGLLVPPAIHDMFESRFIVPNS
ncbi:MAG: 2'-5' RNA ligase family protein, partial [Thermomicrobiales bacterium]